MRRIKVFYFTRVELGVTHSGGGLVCRNHVQRMASDPRLDVTLCTVGLSANKSPTDTFAASIGVPSDFVPFQESQPRAQTQWPFFFELEALSQPQIDAAVLKIVDKVKPDVIAVDYLFSALFARSLFSIPVRRIVITLNRETEFYKNLRRLNGVPPDPSEDRLTAFEHLIYEASNFVVVLSVGDTPSRVSQKTRVIAPLFDRSNSQWSYTGNNNVLFVGNVAHHPNLEAVEWLATQLAPALETIGSKAQIHIIGMFAEQAPAAWKRTNLTYLGTGDSSLVTKELIGANLFIAPIANNFGSKIKLLDCLSHGTPFIATNEAMSGLSFLDGIPRISLDQPRRAAETIDALLPDKAFLTSISHRNAQQLLAALKAHEGDWGDLFEQVMSSELPPPVALPLSREYGAGWHTRQSSSVERDPTDQSTWGKVRLNEPCPCGSNRKYKHCHGRLI